jgi:formate hydrogenlyase transcriptional activator
MPSAGHQPASLNIQLLVDSIPALIHTARPDGYLDYFNKPWLEYLGIALDDVAGWNWTAYIHPEDVEGIVAKWRACLANGEIFEYETRVRSANGEYRWMFHRKVPLRDANGNIVKWYGSSLDIEERKAAEQKIREQETELRNLLDLMPQQVFVFGPDGSPIYANQGAFEYFGVDAGQLLSESRINFVHLDDREYFLAKRNKSLLTEAPHEFEARLLRHDGIFRWFLFRRNPLKDERGHILRWYGTGTDIDDRKRAEEALRTSEAYLGEAQRLSHTGSFGWRSDNGEIVWSDETYRIFEYDRSVKPTIDSVVQRVHPEDRAGFEEVINRALAGATDFEHAYRLLLPDGQVKHVHALAHVLQDAFGNREFVGAVTDITERRAAEIKVAERTAELRRSERELRGVIDTIPAIVWSTLPDGSNTYVNKRFVEYSGSSAEQTAGSGWQALIHPDDRERHAGKWMEAVATGKPLENEVRSRRSDGQYRWQLDRGVPLRDEDGNIVKWYGVTTDIEDRKRAEDKIREQETELRQMLDLAPQHVAVYGPNRERLYANRVLLDYVGFSLEEWRQSRPGDYVRPDEKERSDDFFDRAVARASADELEVRLRKHDGSYRWFLARFNPLRDEQGQITRWYVTGTDIEDRKQAEDTLRRENVALREEIDKASMFEEIVGTSPALQTVLSRISKVAASDSTVIITGETGTGKELVARAIHRRSDRSSRVFVSVNCAAVPRDLIASELFGHEKGAFTGATQQRLGRFELANGGTLFLDEVGELPAETQIALLRVLQEHEFERVGGTRPIRADVRVIAATNRDLQAAISAGSFRSDLFYRLHVFPIEIPALRERKEDIRLLVEYFIDRYARKAGKRITTVDKKTLRLLESYYWPGNIRELQNVIERSVIVCETANFSVDESWLSQQPLEKTARSQLYFSEKVATQEKEIIEAALRECQGRVFGPSGAAAKLGIARSTLESKIKSHKINKNRFRA